jgi:hypothetical protein
MVLYIIGGSILALSAFAVLGNRIQKKEIQEIFSDIQKLEAIYVDYVEQKINHQIIKTDDVDLDAESLHKEILAYLKPHIDSVINHINRLEFSSIDIPETSARFNNVTSTAEILIVNKEKNEDKQLSREQINTFVQSVSDTVNSDLQERILRLNQ